MRTEWWILWNAFYYVKNVRFLNPEVKENIIKDLRKEDAFWKNNIYQLEDRWAKYGFLTQLCFR